MSERANVEEKKINKSDVNFKDSNAKAEMDDSLVTQDTDTTLDVSYQSCDKNETSPADRYDECDNYELVDKTVTFPHQKCFTNSDINRGPETNYEREVYHTENIIQRKIFECDVCNMKFSNGANMRRHKMRHTGVKPYECRICQKRFFRKDHLAEHFTTHSKTLPYHCPVCNRGFQRQIAMRAHFQNEHVGQHDVIKSCPLCNYTTSTMKYLRLHFYNRHGIDLDSTGPKSALSLIRHNMPAESVFLSDSGDSLENRSVENVTPPMHFLTPHVEISIPYSEQISNRKSSISNDYPNSPQSAESSKSNNAAIISRSCFSENKNESTNEEDMISPSISLIPIKQESVTEKVTEVTVTTSSNIPMPPLIKVSPLKSLLHEDFRHKSMVAMNSKTIGKSTYVMGSIENDNSNSDEKIEFSKIINDKNNNDHDSDQNTYLHDESTDLSNKARYKELQCTYCRITFPDQTLYFLHKGCHSDSNPWKCNICGEQCCNLYQFNSHLLSKSHQ